MAVDMIVILIAVLAGVMRVVVILAHLMSMRDVHGHIPTEGIESADGQNQKDIKKTTHEEIKRTILQAMNSILRVKVIVYRAKCSPFVACGEVRGSPA